MKGRVVAPGLPVAAGPEELRGPDGAYRVREGKVVREAGGAEGELVELDPSPPPPESLGFDLLWFGPAERYLVRDGRVEIEDLFARVVAPVDRGWLEETLLRRGRHDPALLEGMDTEPSTEAPTIEVRRPEQLTGEGWEDPRRLVALREMVETVNGEGDEIRARFSNGECADAALATIPGGWAATFTGQVAPWHRLWCRRQGKSIVYGAEPSTDPRDPGVRTRWAFDLMSDLLRLAKS